MPRTHFISALLKAYGLSVFALGAGVSASATVMSTFDTDIDGWLVAGDATSATPQYMAAGGNPGGFVEADDRAAGGIWYWQAPTKFLGDQSAAWGGSLSFDLTQNKLSSQLDRDDVILTGGGLTIVFDTANNPGLDWTEYSIDLNDTAGWTLDTAAGAAATAGQIQTVLGNLGTLRIRGEYVNGSDTGQLDNVILTPEPASLALLGLGALAMHGRRRR